MKINIGKILDRMKLGSIPHIRLLPDDFKPEKKHFRISIALAVMYSVIAIFCMVISLIDESRSYLKPVTMIMCILVAIFVLMTLEIQNRLKTTNV